MDSGADLLGGEEVALGEGADAGEAVRVLLVRPALRERGVEQRTDALGVGCAAGCSLLMPRRAALTARPRMRYCPEPVRSTVPGVRRRCARPSRCAAARAWESWLTSWYASCGSSGPAARMFAQRGGVGKPLVDDVDEVVVLDGVEDLDEARVAEKGGGAGCGEHRAGAVVARGKDVDADGAAQFLVDCTPTAESVQTGDALLQAVPPGELVAAVQLGRSGRRRRWPRRSADTPASGASAGTPSGPFSLSGSTWPMIAVSLSLSWVPPVASASVLASSGGRLLLRSVRSAVGAGLVHPGDESLVLAAVLSHADGSCTPFRHRRSCLPNSLQPLCETARQLCPQSDAMHDTQWPQMVVPSAPESGTHHTDHGCHLRDPHPLRS